MLSGIISTLRGLAINLDLVPTTFGFPVIVKYGGPDQMPPPTPTPTATPTPTPLFTMTPEQATAFNQYLSGIVPSWANGHAPFMPSFNLSGVLSSSHMRQPQASNPFSFGFPRFMDMDLFSPAGFISFVGFVIAITLPLWAILGLAYRGGFWYLRSNVKKK